MLLPDSKQKEYEQMPVLLLFFRQVKPALWKAPLGGVFLLVPDGMDRILYRAQACALRGVYFFYSFFISSA